MKLRTAFVLSLLAVLLVMAVPALYGLRHVRQLRHIALDLREQAAQSALVVGRINASLERLDRYQRAYVATADPGLATSTRIASTELLANVERLRALGYGAVVDNSQFPLDQLRTATARTVRLVTADSLEAATTHLNERVTPLLDAAEGSISTLAAGLDQSTAAQVAEAERITGHAVTTTSVALIVAVLVSGLLTVVAARFLTRPMGRLSHAMSRVADGRFEPPHDLPYERQDEVGDLFRAFRSMALRLADLDRMKAEFVGVASHDLKTPVSVITGYSEMLDDELAPSLDQRHREILHALREQSRSLGQRVNQLLEISRMEAGGLRLGLEEINLRHFASSLQRAYGAVAARQDVEVSARVDDSAPSFLIADPDCIQTEVLGNLMENALKFSPKGGRIDIRISGHGGTVTFEIHDDGPRIDPEDIPFVFDRYYQGRGLPGRVGAGLGLPIARAGVQAHGGTIDVESPPDGGALFRFTLPVHPTLIQTTP